MSAETAIPDRCATCLELFLAYVASGNDWVELTLRSLGGTARSEPTLLQSARCRKSAARRRLLLHQCATCGSCPNHIRPA